MLLRIVKTVLVVVVTGSLILSQQRSVAGDWLFKPSLDGGPHLWEYHHSDSDYSHLSNVSPVQPHPRDVPYSVTLHNTTSISISYSINNQQKHELKPGESVKWTTMGSKENQAHFKVSFDAGTKKTNRQLDNFAVYDFQSQGKSIEVVKRNQHPPSVGSIKVRFTNRTNETVLFYLNGGAGLWTQLKPGQSSEYTMATYQNLIPAIEIYQPKGGGASRRFSVENGGRYALNFNKNGIENFYDK